MKAFLAIVLVALIGASRADDLDDVKTFLQCVNKALVEGVPTIPVPKHDPLYVRNFTFDGEKALVKYSFSMTNTVLHGLLNYSMPVVNATPYHNPELVLYDYEVYWPQLTLEGNWELDVKIPFFDNDMKGTFKVDMYEVDWSGYFNITRPGQEAQGYNTTVNDYTLHGMAASVDVHITGLPAASVVDLGIETYLYNFLNNIPLSVADFFRVQRFNGFWVGKNFNLLLDFCGLPHN